MGYIDLITLGGEIIRIEVPRKHFDECWEHIEQQMKIGGWFCPARWVGCRADYLGHPMERIAMNKVIGAI